MNYEQAVEYIESTPKFTKKNRPENTEELIRRIGRPERNMKVIHVAGTNGKGSVCAFLASILTRAGKRTGGYYGAVPDKSDTGDSRGIHRCFCTCEIRS